MNKAEKIASFDPNGPGQLDQNIFGLPFTAQEAEIVILPVPWEVTVSYGGGTIDGPDAIKEASLQVDLYDADAPETWKAGIHLLECDETIRSLSQSARAKAETYIDELANGANPDDYQDLISEINTNCETMIDFVETETGKLLDQGKITALLGGDHSTPLGFLKALAKRHESFGILQVDAHMDLRIAYEGFTYSHASIMYNALQLPQVSKLVQVGIRDYCQEEIDVMNAQGKRVKTYFDDHIQSKRFEGRTWADQVAEIIDALPDKVYLSFDIDGLDPTLCPNTGTPVPGGLSYAQAIYLMRKLALSDKQIIGFDLNEVSPGETDWDANVGARLLFKQCVFAAISKGIVSKV
jgi:agmatinase